MFEKSHYTQFVLFFATGILLFSLTSCSDEKRIHSNYIPSNSCAVININTEKIFNDAVFDLMSNNDLGVNLSLLPLSSILQDPSAAGLKVFAKYHIFMSGSSLLDAKIGAVLPLNDSEDLAEYVKDNFNVEVLEQDGFQAAKIFGIHNIVWDDYTAIYYFGISDTSLIEEGKKFFLKSEKESLASKDSTFYYALSKDVHISTWIKNQDVFTLMNQIFLNGEKISPIDFVIKNNNTFTNGKTVFLTSFNKGNIAINQRQYISSEQTPEENERIKENDISGLVPMAISENPLVLLRTTFEPNLFAEVVKLFGFDMDWASETPNFPFLSDINQLSDYFQGDFLVLVDDFEEVIRTKELPDLDDEGNDIMVSKQVKEKAPTVSVGLMVKDSIKFNFMLNLLSSKLPKVDGFFNYNNEAYFATKGNYFFLTSTKKGIKALNEMRGKLSSDLNSLITANQSVYYFDIDEILKQDERLNQFSIPGIYDLNSILFWNKSSVNKGIIESETRVNFTNQQNSFVSTLKLLSALFDTLNPSHSIGLQ